MRRFAAFAAVAVFTLLASDSHAQTTGVRMDVWSGATLATPQNLADNPNYLGASTTNQIQPTFEAPTNVAGARFVTRMTARIVSPTNGSHTFWIACNYRCMLWVSTSPNFFGLTPVARMMQPTPPSPRQYTRYAEQRGTYTMAAGTTYYIQAVLIENGDAVNHMAVRWQLPTDTMPEGAVIPGNRLSPYTFPPPPTVTLTASPTSVVSGQSSTLTWSSTNATSCTASGGWSGAKATSGSQSFVVSATTSFTLTCNGVTGSASSQATVTYVPPPTLGFLASPATIGVGQSSNLSWGTTNATSCTASGGWSGTRATSGNLNVFPTTNTSYTLTCSGPGGSITRTTSVTVNATPPPTVNISANPNYIVVGNSATLSWSTTNATSCTASGAWSGSRATSGSVTVSPQTNADYFLSCTGAGGTSPNSVAHISVSSPTLAWDPVSATYQVHNYIVSRSQVAGPPWTVVGNTGTSTSFPITGISGYWCFAVQSQNTTAASPYSQPLCTTF